MSEIKAGDLVCVVKPTPCCGHTYKLGAHFEDWEWMEVGPGVYQNKRCGHVFKDVTENEGKAYYIDGRIFREPNGACYTSKASRVYVTFPYTPVREYVDVPE